jgi:hypothetical protein
MPIIIKLVYFYNHEIGFGLEMCLWIQLFVYPHKDEIRKSSGYRQKRNLSSRFLSVATKRLMIVIGTCS